MENSRNPEPGGPPRQKAHHRDRFTLDALASTLTETLQLTPDTPLFVAYSGGRDSHVLLHGIAALREHAAWQVAAIHIDHGLQRDSAQWERHCADVCAALNVPYRSERVTVQGVAERGLEDAARQARYAALRRLLPEGAVLLTAHHRDDQAETLLLQLLRGAGPPGLAAMPALARFGRGRIARPLLRFDRAALTAYAQGHALQWIEDVSNRDTGPARNFLRHRVWPVLTERWPHAAARLVLAARHQAEAAALLDELGQADIAACADGAGALLIPQLQAFSPERQRNLLRCWIRAQGAQAPAEPVLRQVLARVARTPATQHAAVRWHGAEMRRYRDRLMLCRPMPATAAEWEAAWSPGETLHIGESGWRFGTRAAVGVGIARARIEGKTLRARLRRGGERCLLHGHHRKVKKLLQEAGIPPWERGHWPLVYVDGELAAIGDRWVCDPYAAHPGEDGLVIVMERETSR